jgi:hypothetical protein
MVTPSGTASAAPAQAAEERPQPQFWAPGLK